MKTGLVWFKNDLRIADNEALTMAIKECDNLVFCFCIEPHLFKSIEYGFRKTDVNRLKFIKQCVTNLQNKLFEIGGHLIISGKSAAHVIPQLIEEFKISVVYGETEYTSEELELIDNVRNAAMGVEFKFYWGKTLYHLDDIPFTIDKIPMTSKAYRIPVGKESEPRTSIDAPKKVISHPKANSSRFPEIKSLGFTSAEWEDAEPYVEGGEDNAKERLDYYTFKSEKLTTYRWTRNGSMGMDYSSKLSPYLALGCISPREIYRVVKDYENKVKKNQSTWWLVFELVWRDYFTFKGMRFSDKIFKTEGYKNKSLPFENNKKLFTRWMKGETGIPFVDAHLRQLNQTGFMSNRGRVNCSSYLIHDLKIDWTWGAAYFESRLIDYDVSSNWLNWHYQAYEIWYTNPVHQSNKYKAQDFIRKWVPELKDLNDIEILLPWQSDIKTYPKPIEVYKKWQRSINAIESRPKT